MNALPLTLFALLGLLLTPCASAEAKRCSAPGGKVLFTDEPCPPGYRASELNPNAALSVVDASADRQRDARLAPRVQAQSSPSRRSSAALRSCQSLLSDKQQTNWRLMNNRALPNDLGRLRDLESSISQQLCDV